MPEPTTHKDEVRDSLVGQAFQPASRISIRLKQRPGTARTSGIRSNVAAALEHPEEPVMDPFILYRLLLMFAIIAANAFFAAAETALVSVRASRLRQLQPHSADGGRNAQALPPF